MTEDKSDDEENESHPEQVYVRDAHEGIESGSGVLLGYLFMLSKPPRFDKCGLLPSWQDMQRLSMVGRMKVS